MALSTPSFAQRNDSLKQQLSTIQYEIDELFAEVREVSPSDNNLSCVRMVIGVMKDNLDPISRFQNGSNVSQRTINAYRSDLNALKSRWNDCLEQADENNQILLQAQQKMQKATLTLLQAARERIHLIPNSSDRELFREFIDFLEDMVLSNNTRCQNQINYSDPDFLALIRLAQQNFSIRRSTELRRRFNLLKEKWDRCIAF